MALMGAAQQMPDLFLKDIANPFRLLPGARVKRVALHEIIRHQMLDCLYTNDGRARRNCQECGWIKRKLFKGQATRRCGVR